MNQSLACKDSIPDRAQRSVCENEVGVEEDKVVAGHSLAEIGESAMERERQRHAIATFSRNQVVDGNESDWAVLLGALECHRIPDLVEKESLGHDHELA